MALANRCLLRKVRTLIVLSVETSRETITYLQDEHVDEGAPQVSFDSPGSHFDWPKSTLHGRCDRLAMDVLSCKNLVGKPPIFSRSNLADQSKH